MLQTPVFKLSSVTYRYLNQTPGLSDISMQIHSGQAIVVLGANGSGKSTLLKILDGLYFPQKGDVRAYDVRLTEKSLQDTDFSRDFRRRVGLVFQDPDVQLFLPTVKDELSFAPLQMGLAQDAVERRVAQAFELLGIAALADRAPYHLSEGEKKKVALAAALTLDPEVWLLDEPTASLDPRTQSWVIDFLLQLSEQDKTLVIATHDLEIAHLVAHKCYVLGEDHRLLREGSPRAVLDDQELLVKANLIHSHRHYHLSGTDHKHPHRH